MFGNCDRRWCREIRRYRAKDRTDDDLDWDGGDLCTSVRRASRKFGNDPPGRVVIALSNSGETDELLALIPSLKSRKVPIIAIVGNLDSSLAGQSNAVLDASVDREACPLNLAPTTSTTVALAIGDALAMTLMESKGLTPEEFALNHPAGRLGKRLTMLVSTLMQPSPSVDENAVGWR